MWLTFVPTGTAAGQTVEPKSIPAYSVAPVRYQIEPASKIGSKKAGAICLPAGTIIWRDAVPNAEETAAAVASVLKETGGDVFVPGTDWLDETPIKTRYRVIGTVSAAALSVCSPNWGVVGSLMGSRRMLKARGKVRMVWRTYDRTTRALVAKTEIESPFAMEGEATMGTAMKAGIVANARLLVASVGTLPDALSSSSRR